MKAEEEVDGGGGGRKRRKRRGKGKGRKEGRNKPIFLKICAFSSLLLLCGEMIAA